MPYPIASPDAGAAIAPAPCILGHIASMFSSPAFQLKTFRSGPEFRAPQGANTEEPIAPIPVDTFKVWSFENADVKRAISAARGRVFADRPRNTRSRTKAAVIGNGGSMEAPRGGDDETRYEVT